VPYIAGEFYRTYVPSGSRYVNDHTLVMGPDGTWHVYGITHDSAGDPEAEHQFLHATAPTLFGPWSEQPDVLVADARMNEKVLWAPHVIEREPGRWALFYYADLLDENPMRGPRRAESTDLWHWQRVEGTASPSGRPPGGRDPFALREQVDRLLVFSVGVDETSHGQILLTESQDLSLERWSSATPVLTDPNPATPWRRGNVQSPFVVVYDKQFYLFVTRKSPLPIDYVRTNVFCSDDPRHFDWRPIAELRAHAAEVVTYQGRHFITSAGWTKAIGEAHRGLSIAPLEWADSHE
jgi:beta-fructofuranosidase